MEKRALGLILILLMFTSTIAFSLLQRFFYTPTIKLPKTRIFSNGTLEEELGILRGGYTLIKFSFNENCEGCLEMKDFLENLVYSPGFEEIYLEEIYNQTLTQPNILVASIYGWNETETTNQTLVLELICNLMINPPLECAL
jgi:hypothetical protein